MHIRDPIHGSIDISTEERLIIDSRFYAAKLAGQPAAEKDVAKKAEYEKELPEIQEKAGALEKVSKAHLETHETYEMSATMFHIAIAVVAIAVVAKRKEFWWMSIVGGVIGLYFFGAAYAHAPHEAEHHEASAEHGAAVPGAGHSTTPAGEHEAAAPKEGAGHEGAAPAGGEGHH